MRNAHLSSFHRCLSFVALGLLAVSTLSACGGTDNEVNDWWYNNTYAAPN